jgi:hypothetical protein
LTSAQFIEKTKEAAENSIYKRLYEELSVAATQEEIKKEFQSPKFTVVIQVMRLIYC